MTTMKRFAIILAWLILVGPLRGSSNSEETIAPGSSEQLTSETARPRTTTLSERFGQWAFVTLIPSLEPLRASDGSVLGLSAADCGVCHKAVYDEWKQSTHATALQDIQYLAELAKEGSPTWLCLNCHTPLQDQREYLVAEDTRLEDHGQDIRFLVKEVNPGFDPALRQESITCATCHVRRDEEGNSYVIVSATSGRAPHPVRVGREVLRSSCKRCHNPGLTQLTVTFVCWFETVDELAAGPYEKDCVDCHMPETTRALVEGLPSKRTRQHHWVGGGVPKWFEAYDTLLERGYEPGLDVRVREIEDLIAGETARLVIDYENARAGHWLPTADPERYLMIDVTLRDASERVLFNERLKIGQSWDWGDERSGQTARRLRDNRLEPREKRTWTVEAPLPREIVGARLTVTALHVRLTIENAEHMKQTKGVEDHERYLSGVTDYIQNVERHYPFFSYIFREEIDLETGSRRRHTPGELIELSQAARELAWQELGEILRAPEIVPSRTEVE